MLQHQGEDPMGKPLICSTNPTAVSLRGHRREVPPADSQERAHSCHSEAWAKGNAKDPHFPPDGTANMRVGKPTVLI
ncbi:hypothetical protein TNCV_4839751 [Trichonephila clavipes]|nr:hypothetical protein TNCV_4839751 [Trichonephila clavipes]